MKILIVNQPTKNRGDEAAHKSFMRGLSSKINNAKFVVLFNGETDDTINQMKCESEIIDYVNIDTVRVGFTLFLKYLFLLNLPILGILHPLGYKYYKFVKNSDYIICAPGGISMGAFQNWEHIYILYIAQYLKIKVAYYSRSFGPFDCKNIWAKIYTKYSIRILKRFNYLSIRDEKSMAIAENLGIKYYPSIDSAFLDCIDVEIPEEISKIINGKKYAVFVPNSLIWHPAYKKIKQEKIDAFYISIVNEFLAKNNYDIIVMLPQLFNNSMNSDEDYFNKIKYLSKYEDMLYVVPEIYSSDIQQKIISKSSLVVSARYHSIIFAINNNVPFIALSYEHKINGMLQMLNKKDYMVNIENIDDKSFDVDKIIKEIKNLKNKIMPDKVASVNARNIAIECMDGFIKNINKN